MSEGYVALSGVMDIGQVSSHKKVPSVGFKPLLKLF